MLGRATIGSKRSVANWQSPFPRLDKRPVSNMDYCRIARLMHGRFPFVAILVLFGSHNGMAEDLWAGALLKSESFDRDPGWDAFNNHVQPKRTQTVTQDF